MRLLFASVASTVISFTAAVADGHEIKASISKIDRQSDRIVLDNGYSYRVSDDIAIEALREGIEITLTYREQDGIKTAVQIDAEPAGARAHQVACKRHIVDIDG